LGRDDLGRFSDARENVEALVGTATRPTLGSMVQNGKLAACAAAVAVSALNSVDLPTFGNQRYRN